MRPARQVFLVDLKATKKSIKEAVAALYDIQCKKVNTLIRWAGGPFAYARTQARTHAPVQPQVRMHEAQRQRQWQARRCQCCQGVRRAEGVVQPPCTAARPVSAPCATALPN